MDNEPEIIRREMAETRASLTDKIETLENKVVGTVQDATLAVHDTVENVKDAVQETVTSVKDTVSDTVEGVRDVFDLSLQVDRHPCLMMGAAVAVGYIGGSLLSRRERVQHPLPPVSEWSKEPRPAMSNGCAEERVEVPPASPQTKHSWMDLFGPELAKFKGLAIGYLMSAVRDAVSDALPNDMRSQLHETMDSITHKLGGQPVHGSVLGVAKESTSESGQSSARGPEKRTTNGPYTEARSRW